MRVVLVQPLGDSQFPVPPLGLGYLAAVLERRGFNVKIIDLNVESSSAFEEHLSRERPEVVGVSCAVGNAREAFAVVSKVKDHFPECFVVVGGPYASIMGEEMLVRHLEIDAAVAGEGEATLVELMERLQSKQGLNDVNGLIFRYGSKTRRNPSRDPVEALDSLLLPDREKSPMKLYRENAGVLFTSRGCPYQCVFLFTFGFR
jgi:anaerobic magnesium-protoporphyrin IX monomethyl ester cyclase